MLFQAPEEEGADGSIGEPGAVDGGRNGSAPAVPQPAHGFLQSAIDGVVFQSPQKTIQRGVVGYRWQFQYGAQLLLPSQAHLGFAKGPVFVGKKREKLNYMGDSQIGKTSERLAVEQLGIL